MKLTNRSSFRLWKSADFPDVDLMLYILLLVRMIEVGRLAPIAVVMLPEALAFEALFGSI